MYLMHECLEHVLYMYQSICCLILQLFSIATATAKKYYEVLVKLDFFLINSEVKKISESWVI